MPEPPAEVFDPNARMRRLVEICRERGIPEDDITVNMSRVFSLLGQSGQAIALGIGCNPPLLRFTAAACQLWSESFDHLADYSDLVLDEKGDTITTEAEAFLRNPEAWPQE